MLLLVGCCVVVGWKVAEVGSCAAAVAPLRPSPKGCRVAARPERSDGGSVVEDVAFVSFIKQSIFHGNQLVRQNPIFCVGAR